MPTIITYDHGNEFIGRAFRNDLIKNGYGIKAKYFTTSNPQLNSIFKIIHKVIANIVCTFNFQN